MAFSQATITSGPTCTLDGDLLRVEWTSSDPDGTMFQVYVDRTLTWLGTVRSILLPIPTARVAVQVGTVGATEGPTSFTGSLAALPGTGNKVTLQWAGGRSQATDAVQFRIFTNNGSGGLSTTPTAYINVAPGGIYQDGYGMGGYGSGGWGYVAVQYSWTSPPLQPGSWIFFIRTYDAAGNQSSGALSFVTVTAPPRAPTPFSDGSRLAYTYNSGTRVPTLAWNAAP